MIRHPWRLVGNIIFAAILGILMGYITSSTLKNTADGKVIEFESLMIVYLSMSIIVPIFFLGPCNFMMN